MTYQYIQVETSNHITTITINRPEVMNALHAPAHAEMGKAFDDFDADESAWVAILTGSGEKAFSAGNDLKVTASGQKFPDLKWKGGFGGITHRFDLYKPVIAAVNGLALGGGFELALASDIIIASDNASFGLPEPRVGLFAGAGGIHRLPRMVPFKYAMGMMMSGKPIDAREAHRIGLVSEVVPQANLLETANRWASDILQGAPLSIRYTKQASMANFHMPLEEAITTFTGLHEEMMNSHDRVEGPVAFAEKRKPQWKGK